MRGGERRSGGPDSLRWFWSDRVATLEEAKAQFQKSSDEKAWLGLKGALTHSNAAERPARGYFSRSNLLGLKSSENSPTVAYVGTHIRFGRGRGNGTALLSIIVLCTGCGLE